MHRTGNFMFSYQANIIVDMCTLTGAQGIATGRYHAAHLTNSEVSSLYKYQLIGKSLYKSKVHPINIAFIFP